MQKVKIFNNFSMVTVKRNYYKNHFWYMNKDEVINLLKTADLSKKNRILEGATLL